MPKAIVHMIGQAHLDPAWLWTWTEGRAEALASTQAAVDLLDQYPSFIYTRGEAQIYQWVQQEDPALFARVRQHIAAGRWAVVNGMVVQPDMNLPCGETLVRQFLLGKAYMRTQLGVEPTIAYCVDSFGHAATIPMILAGCGMDSYVFMRPGPHEQSLPGQVFWWQSADGSKVLAFRISQAYCTNSDDLSEHTQHALYDKPSVLADTMCFYGVGDHGGGPTRAQIEAILAMQSARDDSEVIYHFSSPPAYFAAIRSQDATLPKVDHELYYHAVGCYAANSTLKRAFRHAEQRLLLTERMAALSHLLIARQTQHAELDALWHTLCLNSFHDILGGCTIKMAADDALASLAHVIHQSSVLANDAGRAMAARIDTAGSPGSVVLFNPWPHRHQGYIEYEPWTGWQPWDVEGWGMADDTGSAIPWQLIDTNDAAGTLHHGVQRLVMPIDLPALGYRTYRFGPGISSCPPASRVSASPTRLSSDKLTISLDPESGNILSCVEQASGIELVGSQGWNVAQVLRDRSDTWSHGVRRFDELIGHFGETRVTVMDRGPLQASLLVERSYLGNRWVQQLVLRAGTPELLIRNWLYWSGQWIMLKLGFDLAVDQPRAFHDVPFGWVERPCCGDEAPTQMWLDVQGRCLKAAQETVGLGIVDDGRYGCDVTDTMARISVLRCPPYAYHEPHEPDSKPRYDWLDQGMHTFNLLLRPHIKDWRQTDLIQRAREFNMPVMPITSHAHHGDLEAAYSAAALVSDELEMTTLKRSQDGRGYLVRLADRHGHGGRGELQWQGARIPIVCGPHQVISLRLERRNGEWQAQSCNMLERPLAPTDAQ